MDVATRSRLRTVQNHKDMVFIDMYFRDGDTEGAVSDGSFMQPKALRQK
jgi:hypothetical protein